MPLERPGHFLISRQHCTEENEAGNLEEVGGYYSEDNVFALEEECTVVNGHMALKRFPNAAMF